MSFDELLVGLEQIVEDIEIPAKNSIVTAFARSIELAKEGNHNDSIKWAGVVEDFVWERLHSDHWENVPLVYRKLYYLTAAARAKNLRSCGRYGEALSIVDKGLLLGAPILDDLLLKMAEELAEELSQVRLCDQCSGDDAVFKKSANSSLQTSCAMTLNSPIKRTFSLRNYHHVLEREEDSVKKRFKYSNQDDDTEITASNCFLIERIKCPSLEYFLSNYMKPAKPVLLSGCMDHWPALGHREWRYCDHLKLFAIQDNFFVLTLAWSI